MVYAHSHLSKPSTEDEYWTRIEGMFEVAETDFETLRFETEDEAMEKKFESSQDPKNWRLDSMHIIRFRQTDDRESLEYFWDLGKLLLEPLREHIAKRELSMNFLHDWGIFMFCHGFGVVGVFARGEDLGSKRAGKAGGGKLF